MTELFQEDQKVKRLEMISRALQEKAPLTFADLQETGQLQAFLEARDAEMMRYFQDAQQKAWEETLAVFLDFFDPSYDETSSPM